MDYKPCQMHWFDERHDNYDVKLHFDLNKICKIDCNTCCLFVVWHNFNVFSKLNLKFSLIQALE